MSTVAEIRETIDKLNEQDRHLLPTELFATMPLPHETDPEFLATLDEAEADVKAGRVYSVEEVRAMIPKWISESSTHAAP